MIAIRLHNKDNKTSGSFNAMLRLDPDSRNQIIGMLNAGICQREVARRFAVNVSTFMRLNRKFIVTGSTKDRPRSGQPRVTTRRQDNLIRLRHLRDRYRTAVSTAAPVVGRHHRRIHPRTVQRLLKERGIVCRRPYKGQVLTRRPRQRRMDWDNQKLNDQRHNWGQSRFLRWVSLKFKFCWWENSLLPSKEWTLCRQLCSWT